MKKKLQQERLKVWREKRSARTVPFCYFALEKPKGFVRSKSLSNLINFSTPIGRIGTNPEPAVVAKRFPDNESFTIQFELTKFIICCKLKMLLSFHNIYAWNCLQIYKRDDDRNLQLQTHKSVQLHP